MHLTYKDDAYNPTNTVNVVHQLVLQDHVFGIFEGLGTPTHTKVVSYLNASKVPDLFVASGCACWDDGTKQPYTFGWQPNYTIEGKILGQYIKQHFAGQKVAVLYQDDDFGQGGLAGIARGAAGQSDRVKAGVPVRDDDAGAAGHRDQGVKGQGAGPVHRPDLHRDRRTHIVHAGLQAPARRLQRRDRPDHRRRPAQIRVSKGKASGTGLIEGAITDGYLPSTADTSNPWIQLFQKIHDQYDKQAPFDGNVEYGMANAYTLVQALQAAGKNLTRQAIINAINQQGAKWTGPGLVPYRYTQTDHGGYSGTQIGHIKNGKIVLTGTPLTTTPDPNSPITPYTTTQPDPPTTGVPSN